MSPQADFVVSNGTGAAVRSDINGQLAAIVSNSSGASEPATMYAYQWWADTTTGLLKIRNAANSAWVTIGTLASANLGLLPLAGGTMTGVLAVTAGTAALPGIAVSGDTNTGIYSPGADQVAISTGGTGRLFVQSDGDVCIGQSTGDSQLVVKGSTAARTVSQFIANDTSTTTMAVWERSDGAVSSRLIYDGVGLIKFGTSTSHALLFDTNNQTRMTILSGGNVGIGTTSPGALLHLKHAANKNVYFDAGGTSSCCRITAVNDAVSANVDLQLQGDSLLFAANGSERARIDTSGRLLVGTSNARANFFNSSLSAALQLEGTGNARRMSIVGNDAQPIVILAREKSGSVGGNTVVANGDVLGLVSFQGSDGTDFVSGAEIYCEVDGTPGANDMPGRLVFSTTADGAASPTERMRIRNNGDVFINTTAVIGGDTPKVSIDSAAAIATNSATTILSAAIGFHNPNGRIGYIGVSGTTTSYVTSSDYRLKENVTSVTNGIARFKQLKPSRFNFIADPDKTVDGFLAHEVQAIVPEAIHGTKDEVDADGNPKYQGIDQSKLVPLLTAALQEAIAKIEALETRLSALEAA